MEDFKVIETADGSHSVYVKSLDEHYHSYHGALNEAEHVFINNGIDSINSKVINVLEIGYGTGLNTLLTFLYAKNKGCLVNYEAYDTVILPTNIIEKLNYAELVVAKNEFKTIISLPWNKDHQITSYFKLNKHNKKIQEASLERNYFDIVYYDAFGPRAQIEMWDKAIFQKLYDSLKVNGCLVTYCAMGQLKRDLKSIGFNVVSLPGPPGKREMTKAIKI